MAGPWERYQQAQPQPVQISGPDPYKAQEQARASQSAARDAARLQMTQKAQPFERSDKLRQDFLGLPAYKEYRAALPALMSGLKSGADAAGDNALIYAYAKAMDPGSVVRESEMGMAGSTGSWLENAAANLKKQLGIAGGGQLSPQVRDRLRREMNSKVASLAKQYGVSRRDFQQMAQRQGVNPADVVGGFPAEPYFREYARLRPGAKQQAKPSGVTSIRSDEDYNRLPSGATFRAPDGSIRRKP